MDQTYPTGLLESARGRRVSLAHGYSANYAAQDRESAVACHVPVIRESGYDMQITPLAPTIPVTPPAKIFDSQEWPMGYLGFTWAKQAAVLLAQVVVYFKPGFCQEIYFPMNDDFYSFYALDGGLSTETLTAIFRTAEKFYSEKRPEIGPWNP